MAVRFDHEPCDEIRLFGPHTADGDIRLAALQVTNMIGGDNLDLQLRRDATEFLDNRQEQVGSKHVRCRDADKTVDGLTLAGGNKGYAVRGIAHGPHVLQEFYTRRGELQRPADALEQKHAQLRFKGGDLSPKGWLG